MIGRGPRSEDGVKALEEKDSVTRKERLNSFSRRRRKKETKRHGDAILDKMLVPYFSCRPKRDEILGLE